MDKVYDKPLPETGIRAFVPSDVVYAFAGSQQQEGKSIIANLQINPTEVWEFVKQYKNEFGAESEKMHLNIKLSRGGKYYITVDQKMAEGKVASSPQAPAKSSLPWEN